MNVQALRYILGSVLLAEAGLMTLPAFVAVLYKEPAMLHFGVPIALLLVCGIAMTVKKPEKQAFYAKEGFVAVALAWLVMSVFGALPFLLTGRMGGFVDCYFETVSGFTTTGASVLSAVEPLPKGILFWRSFTHWVGGMGVLVFVLAVLPMAGQHTIHLLRAESPGPIAGKLVPKLRSTAFLLYAIYIAMTLVLIVLLMLGGVSLYDSCIHAFGAAGTGGFSNYNNSVGHFQSSYVHNILSLFMMLFGVNFSVYYLILAGQLRQALKSEELRWYTAIIAAAGAIVAINVAGRYDSVLIAVRDAYFQVISIITTTGYATTNFDLWPETSRWVLLFLMFFGACAGSTGGGIKTSRLILLCKQAVQQLKRMLHPRAVTIVKLDGATVSEPVLSGVQSFMTFYVVILLASLFVVSLDGNSFDTTFGSVMACLNNVGPGLGVVGPVGNYGSLSDLSKIVLTIAMLFGRLEIFPMLMLFTPRSWR